MKVLCVFGQNNYGDPRRGIGYEYANFIPALRRLGHDVFFFESRDRSCQRNFAELNRRLLQQVESLEPDVVLSVLTHYEIWRETLEILRDSGRCATVNWATDDSWKYSQFSRFVAPSLHACTTTYREKLRSYRSDGIGSVLLTQWAANIDNLLSPLPASQCAYGVTFVGTAHGDRKRWVTAAQKRGVSIQCFGQGWPSGPIAAERIPEIVRASVISLNFANGGGLADGLPYLGRNQIKARTFEVPGCGGFLLTETADDLERWYEPGREIATFSTIEELTSQVHHYLGNSNERDRVAQAGFERTCREHTYDMRLAEVLTFALRQKKQHAEAMARPSSGVIDWPRFERIVHQHHVTRPLKMVRSVLVSACAILWGRQSAERAARRLLFELSWRVAGRNTYSASGWPGRMFYRVS
jgi:spore maturation protein CgeB